MKRLLPMLMVMGCLLAWRWQSTLGELVRHQASDLELPTGYLVVVLAGLALLGRRKLFPAGPLHMNVWGLALLAAAVGLTFVGAGSAIPLKPATLLPYLAGCCFAAGGWALFRWAAPVLLLLVLLYPLPRDAEEAVAEAIHPTAAGGAFYLLESFAVPCVLEKDVIILPAEPESRRLEVSGGVDAMVMLLAMAWTLVIVGGKDLWKNVLLMLSALPIAVGLNVVRAALTGVLDAELRNLTGWGMVPAALGVLLLERWVLDHIVVEMDARVRPLRTFGLSAPVERDTSAGLL